MGDQNLVQANKAKLRAMLLYHGVKGEVTAAQAVKRHSAETLEGNALSSRVSCGNVIVGGATVITPNVTTCNGSARQTETSLR
jgi:uncharacterized surface protein with fasciclin (FAS1) repeats